MRSSLFLPNRSVALVALSLLACGAAWPKVEGFLCGSTPDRLQQEVELHRKAARRQRGVRVARDAAVSSKPATTVNGNLVLMEDSDGVVSRRNSFDLDHQSLTFTPTTAAATAYTVSLGGDTYDAGAAAAGTLIEGFGDDDSRPVALPFPFAFYGETYTQIHLNSDGNLTFGEADTDTLPRTLDRVTTGPPRIAPLFGDLDPTVAVDGVRLLVESGRVVVSWVSVREFSFTGFGPLQTFQVRLYPEGRIEFAFSGINIENAVVAISPGNSLGNSRVISFADGSSEEFSGAVAERFTQTTEVDPWLASQKFFADHEDAYDYLVFYNNMGISADVGAVAYEMTIRNHRSGIGVPVDDFGELAGSPAHLQGLMNMGPLSQYPADPNALVPTRAITGDTPLSVLGHEAGHLFLAFASVRDPDDEDARPMLSSNLAHWNFAFNSEASLLEGNRICDRERTPEVCPSDSLGRRFVTVGAVQEFSPLDQYLMGFRAAGEVPDTFWVENPSSTSFSGLPQTGVNFNGIRHDVSVEQLAAAEGRRTPDHNVAQRRFRFAFVLIHAEGQTPSAADIEKLDRFRREFEGFYNQATGGMATADTTLGRNLDLSLFPASGILLGSEATATLSVMQPAAADIEVLLTSENGAVSLPASATIPAGATSAALSFSGVREGVDQISAEVPGGEYATAIAKVQVLGAASQLLLSAESGNRQSAVPGQPLAEPIVVRATDVNNIPYPNLRIAAAPSESGAVSPVDAITDAEGRVSFEWSPASAAELLEVTLPDLAGTPPTLTITTTGEPSFPANGVVDAASFAPMLSPGSLASIFGVNLAAGVEAHASFPLPTAIEGVRVLLKGVPVPLLYISDAQINFLIPSNLATGNAGLTVSTPLGTTAAVVVSLGVYSPAVFTVGGAGEGAALLSGTDQLTSQFPPAPGQYIEVFCTGLGPVTRDLAAGLDRTDVVPEVTIGGLPATVGFSGLAPGFVGLYQVNVRIPEGVASGAQTLSLSIAGLPANNVWIMIQ